MTVIHPNLCYNEVCYKGTVLVCFSCSRRQFTTMGLDYIACYLVELQAIGSMDRNVRTLVTSFKELQAKVERL